MTFIEPEVPNEDITAILKAKFDNNSSPTAPIPVAEGASEEGEEAPVTPVPVETPPPASSTPEPITEWEFDTGKKIDKATAQRYLDFDAYLAENPEFVQALSGIVNGTYQVVPVGDNDAPSPQGQAVPTPLPDEIDKDDPTVQFFMSQLKATQDRLDQALSTIQTHDGQLQLQTASTTEALINRARRSFQSDHGLTDDEMQVVYDASSKVNLAALMSPSDPTTGLPRKVDPLTAIEQALEVAYWSIPAYRTKYETELIDQFKADQKKKATLTSLGGSSGSMPKDPKAPTTPEGMKSAAIREVAAAMFPERLGEYS